MSNFPDYLDPIETASRSFLDAHQEASIVEVCRYAYERAPLLKETWGAVGVKPSDIKSMADFRNKIPFISKDSVRLYRDTYNDPTGGSGSVVPGDTTNIGTTSGTTGDPTPIPGSTFGTPEHCYARDHWHIGARPGDYLVEMMFTYREIMRGRFQNQLGCASIHVAMSPDEMPRFCEASRRFRPTSMKVLPNPLINALEAHFERSGEDPVDTFKSYKGAIFGGEPLGDRLKALTTSWGLELYETTALGDFASATQCSMHDGFHAYEDIAYIEAIDPVTAEPVADGEIGELVVTALAERQCPLIRYRTDDLVRIRRGPCGCGRSHAKFELLGRASDQIIVEGRSILPREIMGLVESHSECRTGLFQIVRPARDLSELKLRIGYNPERLSGALENLHSRLYDSIQAQMQIPLAIEMIDERELLKLGPPHKIPRVTKA